MTVDDENFWKTGDWNMCLLVLLELDAFRKLPESMEEALNIGGKITLFLLNASTKLPTFTMLTQNTLIL